MKSVRVLLVLFLAVCPVVLFAGDLVPLKGTLVTTGDVAGPCDPGDGGEGMLYAIAGSGSVSQLGRVTIVQSQCLSLTTFAFSGTITLTSQEGSSVTSSYSGAMIPTDDGLLFHAVTHVIGGTGQFVGAWGDGVADGVASLEPGAVTVVTLDGTVSSRGNHHLF